MANSYYLNAIHLDFSTGAAVPTVNIQVVDGTTGGISGVDRTITNVGPTVQTHITNLVNDALAFAQTKYPGLTITLPPVPNG